MKIFPTIIFFAAFLSLAETTARAQSGGNFTITQAVIASGGGNSNGGAFEIGGTNGQPLAGANLNGGQFAVRGGFWAAQSAPTAAAVAVGGRVRNGKNGIIRRVRVTLTDAATGETRTTETSFDGSYRFVELEINRVYIVRAESKRFVFAPDFHIIAPTESLENLDFTGDKLP